MSEKMFEDNTGRLGVNNFKPSYTITMTNASREVGRLDFNGQKLVFIGDAEESAKAFLNYMTMVWDKRLQEERKAEREKIVAWKRARSYVTGHGDTVEDLLKELEWQVAEREREACAKVCEDYTDRYAGCEDEGHGYEIAAAIRARGEA